MTVLHVYHPHHTIAHVLQYAMFEEDEKRAHSVLKFIREHIIKMCNYSLTNNK